MREIAVITGSRADRGPLASVIKALGEHCVEIKTDGLYGHESFIKEQLEAIRPDIVLLLGDRYECLVAASVAALLTIPIAHIHGGEITEGAVDDSFRHAITKLSYWHFPSCQLHAERINKMGESWENIFVCGAPGVDALLDIEAPQHHEYHAPSPFALVCYHPETLGDDDMAWADQLIEYQTVIISGANTDIGSDKINEYWQGTPYDYRPTIPHKAWLSLMKDADMLIGNSSSFIIEGLTMGKKVIMIGDRQKGRYEDALEMFKANPYPFGKPGTVGPAIAKRLLEVEIPLKPRKQFI